MNLDQETYKTGDWIVHIFYGLGQVISKDNRTLDGEEQLFHRVKTSNSQYWIPIENIDFERIRSVASINQIKYALAIVRRSPKKFSKDYIKRRKEISETLNNVSLYSNVRLIRDLQGRRAVSKFNLNENNLLLNITEQFLSECELVLGEDHEIVEKKLSKALKTSLERI
jgi:RNA polymerase-interacting CarD/CdnL/TRCF family regulator